jgi:hypothetical protein
MPPASGNLLIMGKKIPDQLKAETVAAYLSGGMTQEDACAAFLAKTGKRLSTRTLRFWLAADAGGATAAPADGPPRLEPALRRLRLALAEVETVLVDLGCRAAEREDVAPRARVAVPPAATSGLPIAAATKASTAAAKICRVALPPTAASLVASIDVAADVTPAVIVPMPPAAVASSSVDPVKNGRSAKADAFWDS